MIDQKRQSLSFPRATASGGNAAVADHRRRRRRPHRPDRPRFRPRM